MRRFRYSLALVALLICSIANAQMKPVKFTQQFKKVSEEAAEIIFSCTIDPGWHVYSVEEMDGPIQASFNVDKIEGAELDGSLKPVGNVVKKFEEMFGSEVYYFENKGQFVQKLKLKGGKFNVEGYLQYGACNDQNCLPPQSVEFSQ
ncbi:MAG: hypothetical protein II570_05830 [Bacteroidaceae bacterium]|nr:hypothetical protein [Bacteroidaceae bacterium]